MACSITGLKLPGLLLSGASERHCVWARSVENHWSKLYKHNGHSDGVAPPTHMLSVLLKVVELSKTTRPEVMSVCKNGSIASLSAQEVLLQGFSSEGFVLMVEISVKSVQDVISPDVIRTHPGSSVTPKHESKYLNERISNLSAEQSNGITVFRISTMTSLVLHWCRSGPISLEKWWQYPSAAIRKLANVTTHGRGETGVHFPTRRSPSTLAYGGPEVSKSTPTRSMDWSGKDADSTFCTWPPSLPNSHCRSQRREGILKHVESTEPQCGVAVSSSLLPFPRDRQKTDNTASYRSRSHFLATEITRPNPLHYCVWGWLKSDVYKCKMETREELLARNLHSCTQVKECPNQLRSATQQLSPRAAKCIEVEVDF
ncbi:hypothetical protein ANN_18797 [Periplaneta americana]|uniref:Uncharacterized protein n=1 Tax=Periplaneta americana TaxID=6978 RepID=A0ABQ8SPR7_PERAM|nr:hypothetical protein ANN_18797 [Periplaneta americana]